MKILSLLLVINALFLCIHDSTPVKSGVYNTKGHGSHGRNTIMQGSTTFFENFQMDIVTVVAGDTASLNYKLDDMEELVIVQDGSLKVTTKDNSKSIGPGGVAFVLPGEEHMYENATKKPVTFYLLKFKSKSPAESQRAITNGGSFIMGWEDVPMKATEKGSLRSFFNRPTAMCSKLEMHVTTLNEGLASHPPHTHAEEEIVILLKGKAKMNIDNKYYDAPTGSVIFLASEVPHALQNAGKGPAEYFAFQWK